jgi:hypothetical protein
MRKQNPVEHPALAPLVHRARYLKRAQKITLCEQQLYTCTRLDATHEYVRAVQRYRRALITDPNTH